jgi:hypothetical protein
MDQNILISVIAESNAPMVMRAGHLVTSLRMCSMFARTGTAARIQLPTSEEYDFDWVSAFDADVTF